MNRIEAVQIIENMLNLERALLKQFESKKSRDEFVRELKTEISAMCAVVSWLDSGTIVENPDEVSGILKNMINQNFKYIRRAKKKMDFSELLEDDFRPDSLYDRERYINKLSIEITAINFAIDNLNKL